MIMSYDHNLLTTIDNFRAWVSSGTISKMQIDQNTNLTMNADNSKLHFKYTSGTQVFSGSLKLPKSK